MIKKFSGASLKQCILLPQFENCLLFWDYVIAYEYILAKADFIYMLFPNIMIISFLPNGDSKYS
jgi:hypothetical protein